MVDIPFDVRSQEYGTRLDVFLTRRIKRMSRNVAATLIRQGMVSRRPGQAPGAIAALATKPALHVLEGDRILLKRKRLEEAPTDDIQVPVVYADDRILAVSKPG